MTSEPPKTEAPVEDIEIGKDADNDIPNTNVDVGLLAEEVERQREKYGWNEIPAPTAPLYVLFVHQFTGFLAILIEVAAIISLAVQDWTDFGIIVGILLVNGCLGFREEFHAKKSLDELSTSLESEIAVRRAGETKAVPTKELVPGDICLLVGGTVVPADIKYVKGDTMSVDTAALTGEPIPRKYPSSEYGDVILSGSTIIAGECYGIVVKTGINTEIGKAQANVLSDKAVRIVSVFQEKIMRLVQIFVICSITMVITVFLVMGVAYQGFQNDLQGTILASLSILIASIPVALPLVLQVNLALGASFLAKEHHAIVTSIPALQDIASMSILCSDKTGTLTTAKMAVIRDQVVAVGGFTKEDVIRLAKLCSNADKKDDPIDKAVLQAYEESEVAEEDEDYTQTEIIGFNPIVKRVVAFVNHKGKILTVAKGLPAKIIDTEAGGVDDHECQWRVEDSEKQSFVDDLLEKDKFLSKSGYKTIGIAMCDGDARKSDHGPWKFVGLMPLLDPPREDTQATIESLHHANISVKMITGDHVNVGIETCRLIGLGTDIHAGEEIRNATNPQQRNAMIWAADGFASVLPSDKREVVLTLKNEFGLVIGMTGDGVNDAPALSAAQGAVLESRRIFARIKAYVVYRMAASVILVLVLSTVAFVDGCAVDSLLIILLALFNDISMLPVAYDKADATSKPQLPNTMKLFLTSVYYALFHTSLSLIFIFAMSYSTSSLEQNVDLSLCNDSTRGFVWMHLVLVTELTIFSVRAPSYFWSSTPSVWLVGSVLSTCIICSFIAVYASNISGLNLLWIWLFNIGSFAIVDIAKVQFRDMINDAPGGIIESDNLVSVAEKKTEIEKFQAKQQRYRVHRNSALDPADLKHSIRVGSGSSIFDLRDSLTDGISFTQPGARLQYAVAGQDEACVHRRMKAVSAPQLTFR